MAPYEQYYVVEASARLGGFVDVGRPMREMLVRMIRVSLASKSFSSIACEDRQVESVEVQVLASFKSSRG